MLYGSSAYPVDVGEYRHFVRETGVGVGVGVGVGTGVGVGVGVGVTTGSDGLVELPPQLPSNGEMVQMIIHET